jgi:hypothetical protein
MEKPRSPRPVLDRLADALNSIADKLWRKKSPAMIGLPPSARGLTGRPADPRAHAKQLAREWEDVAESYIRQRMRQLEIPDHQIGAPDYERGGVRRVFLADESLGGSCVTGRRLFVDSGVLNPDLDADVIGAEASNIWAKSRLRDRIDAVIVHEYLEAQGLLHDDVVQRAADCDLPISENARRILRRIAEGVRRGHRRDR